MSKRVYDDALKNSVFHGRLEYINPDDPDSKDRGNNGGTRSLVKIGDNNNNHSNRRGRNRNRKVIWFNPPFCKLTDINIGKYFLHLLDKYFNRDNSLSNIFNRNTVEISYFCTKNMHNILNKHNRKLLNELIINGQMLRLVTVEVNGNAS